MILEYPSHKIPEWVRDQQAAEAAAREGVDFVRLLHLFPRDGDHWSHNGGIHPDKDGHRRIAEALLSPALALLSLD